MHLLQVSGSLAMGGRRFFKKVRHTIKHYAHQAEKHGTRPVAHTLKKAGPYVVATVMAVLAGTSIGNSHDPEGQDPGHDDKLAYNGYPDQIDHDYDRETDRQERQDEQDRARRQTTIPSYIV